MSTFPHTSILSGADNYFNAYDALLLEFRTVLSGARRQSFLTFCELPLHDSGRELAYSSSLNQLLCKNISIFDDNPSPPPLPCRPPTASHDSTRGGARLATSAYPSPIETAKPRPTAPARTAAAAAFPAAEPFPPPLLQPSTQSRPSPIKPELSSPFLVNVTATSYIGLETAKPPLRPAFRAHAAAAFPWSTHQSSMISHPLLIARELDRPWVGW